MENSQVIEELSSSWEVQVIRNEEKIFATGKNNISEENPQGSWWILHKPNRTQEEFDYLIQKLSFALDYLKHERDGKWGDFYNTSHFTTTSSMDNV